MIVVEVVVAEVDVAAAVDVVVIIGVGSTVGIVQRHLNETKPLLVSHEAA